MSAAIDTVTIGSIEDRRLVLGNAQAGRVLSIGSNWTMLRIGIRFAFDDAGVNITGTPRFYFGLLASPSALMANGPLGGSTSHFLGYKVSTATWTRGTGPVRYAHTHVTNQMYVKRVGSTETFGTSGVNSHNESATPASIRSAVFLEITKGSPNFTLQVCINQASTGMVDVTKVMLSAAMEIGTLAGLDAYMDTVAGGSFSSLASATIAVDEATNGDLDSICVAWDRTTLLRVSDIVFTKMA